MEPNPTSPVPESSNKRHPKRNGLPGLEQTDSTLLPELIYALAEVLSDSLLELTLLRLSLTCRAYHALCFNLVFRTVRIRPACGGPPFLNRVMRAKATDSVRRLWILAVGNKPFAWSAKDITRLERVLANVEEVRLAGYDELDAKVVWSALERVRPKSLRLLELNGVSDTTHSFFETMSYFPDTVKRLNLMSTAGLKMILGLLERTNPESLQAFEVGGSLAPSTDLAPFPSLHSKISALRVPMWNLESLEQGPVFANAVRLDVFGVGLNPVTKVWDWPDFSQKLPRLAHLNVWGLHTHLLGSLPKLQDSLRELALFNPTSGLDVSTKEVCDDVSRAIRASGLCRLSFHFKHRPSLWDTRGSISTRDEKRFWTRPNLIDGVHVAWIQYVNTGT